MSLNRIRQMDLPKYILNRINFIIALIPGMFYYF